MDPIGGTNPSSPRLDSVGPRPAPARPNGVDGVSGAVQPQPQPQSLSPAQAVTAPTLEEPMPSPALFNQPSNQPTPGQTFIEEPVQSQKSGKGKKVALVLVGILFILALAGGSYFLGFTMGKSKGRQLADADYQRQQAEAQRLAAEESDTEEEVTDPGQELDVKSLIEPKYVDETIDGEVGKQTQSSDGFVLKVVNIERNFKAEDPNYKLDTSKELVKVNFLIGNVDKSKSKDISSFNFRLENSAAAQLTPENVASYEGKFDTVKLDPGGQAKGSIVYAVNKDEKPLKFIREQRYRISGENREVTTRIVIPVAK